MMFYQFQFQYDEQKALQAIEKLKWIIKQNNIDPSILFQQYDQNYNQNLGVQDFTNLIRMIDPSLSDMEAEFLFQKFDKDRSRSITFKEFKQTLHMYKNQPVSYSPNNVANAEEAIKKLKQSIAYYNVNVLELFAQYKKGYENGLSKHDFKFLLLKIDPSLQQQDIDIAFIIFDADGSGNISFKEFTDILQQIQAGQFVYQPRPQVTVQCNQSLNQQSNPNVSVSFQMSQPQYLPNQMVAQVQQIPIQNQYPQQQQPFQQMQNVNYPQQQVSFQQQPPQVSVNYGMNFQQPQQYPPQQQQFQQFPPQMNQQYPYYK